MRKIKHFAGYGCVKAGVVKDGSCTLHVRVEGNHEWGLKRDDLYDLYDWLVKRFDKSVPDYESFYKRNPTVRFEWDFSSSVEAGDYYFWY